VIGETRGSDDEGDAVECAQPGFPALPQPPREYIVHVDERKPCGGVSRLAVELGGLAGLLMLAVCNVSRLQL